VAIDEAVSGDRVAERARLARLAPLSRALHRVTDVLLREDTGGQGVHIDPEEVGPPTRERWTESHRRAVESPAMEIFRAALRPPQGGTERQGVLDDLARYFGITPEEARRRCLHWESDSLTEWEAGNRETFAEVRDFYATMQSWAFDLQWYDYLQSTGHGFPKSVAIADRLSIKPGTRVLDYGSGSGATAQMFAGLGCTVALADVSRPLLEFARWRLGRRAVPAEYVQLPAVLPEAAFDLVTALDVVGHVHPAEIDELTRSLRRTLRVNGLLVTGFDVRRRSRTNAWHLWEDDLPLRWAIERAGFAPAELLEGSVWFYRAVPTTGLRWRLHLALAWLHLASPPARAIRRARRELARAALVTAHKVLGIRR
jgi:SAM-dependent methyltransferase